MLRPPAECTLLGLPGPVLHGLLLAVGVGLFAWILSRRLALLRRGAPDPRLDRLGARLGRLLIVGFGQSRQPRYRVAGTLHILLFGGFLVLSLRSLSLLAEGFRAGASDLGPLYASLKDWTGLTVLLCCLAAAGRRLLLRPARYHDRTATRGHGGEAYLILGLIALLMLADALQEASALAAAGPRPAGAMPLAAGVASLLAGSSAGMLQGLHLAGFWIHNATLLLFLCLLPLGKHFHVLTALPNVLLSKLPPPGRVKPPRHDQPDLDRLERLGAGRLEDFTWKHLLDFYSCTDCGRCSDHCPAYAAGTPLSPRQISIRCRDAAYEAWPVFGPQPRSSPPLIGGVLDPDAIWSCTTCGACEEACPVLIEYVDKIVDLRRHLVEAGEIPAGLQKPLADLERRGNPYGKPARLRGAWLGQEEEPVAGARLLGAGESARLLLFPDSAIAYDPRLQEIARATARLLDRAGEAAGVLGAEEADSGHEARRMGEEGLFQELRDRNLRALAARSFETVVSPDPHAVNALRHDYRLAQPVRHHSEVLAGLLASGRLRPGRIADGRRYTFHDPCYLGRQNGVYEAPRAILRACGVETVEMERCRSRSFCCGGGSLYLFHEAPGERRMGEMRVEQAERAGAEVIVTGCPFCLLNLEDAIKTTGREGRMEVLDLAELLLQAVPAAERAAES